MPFTKGDPNINKNGRPKGSGKGLKEYDREKFIRMHDREKDAFLAKLAPEVRYKMAEGNPHQTQDTNIDGKIEVSGVDISVRK